MFIGEYTHTVDEKKRISLPGKFKSGLGKKVVITRGFDSCLLLYPLKAWEGIAEKLGSLPMGQKDKRDIGRFLLSGAVETDVDSAGRILIPEFLRDYADLKSKVVYAGVYDRIEIWNDRLWSEYSKRIEKQADSVAEKLGDSGVF